MGGNGSVCWVLPAPGPMPRDPGPRPHPVNPMKTPVPRTRVLAQSVVLDPAVSTAPGSLFQMQNLGPDTDLDQRLHWKEIPGGCVYESMRVTGPGDRVLDHCGSDDLLGPCRLACSLHPSPSPHLSREARGPMNQMPNPSWEPDFAIPHLGLAACLPENRSRGLVPPAAFP